VVFDGGTVYVLVNEAPVRGEDLTGRLAQAMDDAVMHGRCARLALARCPHLRALQAASGLAVVRGPAGAVDAHTFDDAQEAHLALDGDRATALGDTILWTDCPPPPQEE
jgi:hypothetical protein